MSDCVVGKDKHFKALVARLSVLAFFFLLRPREVLSMKGWCRCPAGKCNCNAEVRLGSDFCEIRIKGDKTDQAGNSVCRKLNCVCGQEQLANSVPICPVCCLRKIRMDSDMKVNDKAWSISAGKKEKPLAYDGFLKMLIRLMGEIGEDVLEGDGKTNKFGGQSLRRGGAQRLALEGVPIHLIKLYGRWQSWVVYRYVTECPLDSIDVAKVMIKGGYDGLKAAKFKIGQEVLVPDASHGVWLKGEVFEPGSSRMRVVIRAASGVRENLIIDVENAKVVAL